MTTTKDYPSNIKSFFVYLLMMIALCCITTSLTVLIFNYIDAAFSGKMSDMFFYFDTFIRWNIAMLLVFTPAFFYTYALTQREIRAYPEKLKIVVRKLAIYTTIFIATLFLLGDLMSVIYYFLEGEITQRFILKVLVILLIFGGLFCFFLGESKKTWAKTQLNIFTTIASTLIIATVAYGFYLTGSPFNVRLQKLDRQRIDDLSKIQNNVIEYWRNNKKLPTDLSALNNPLNGFEIPSDPETNGAYEYHKHSDLAFQLCATFDLVSKVERPNRYYNSDTSWKHDAGRACFTRTIDPRLIHPK